MADILPNQSNAPNSTPDKKNADVSKIIFVSLIIIAVVLSCFITWGILTGNGSSLSSDKPSALGGFSFLAEQISTAKAGAGIKLEVIRHE